MARLTEEQLLQAWKVLHESRGNISEAARRLGLDRDTFKHRLDRAVLLLGEDVTKSHVGGSQDTLETFERPLPKRGTACYVLTSAQNNTHVHPQLWKNLRALAQHRKAETFVSRFTYNLNSYSKRSVKPGTAKRIEEIWYAPELEPYLNDSRVRLAPGLLWCGELQVEPTAVRPLSGFETYGGRDSCIIPHTSVALESVASGKTEATKFLYSTGAVTELNYIQKKAGFKAEQRHVFGALLVEVDPEGRWFVRQLEQGSDGSLYDLTDRYVDGVRYPDQRVEAITWGDIHVDMIDKEVERIAWGRGGMLDKLHARTQFFHDILNMSRRGHHDRKNAFKMLRYHAQKRDLVIDELKETAQFTQIASREDTESFVVNSNHDRHLKRFLNEADWREDLPNAETILSLQLAQVRAINRRDDDFDITAWALRECGATSVTFLALDESKIICKEFDGGIECGMHGDLGANGARGSAQGFARMGRRANVGHAHTTQIVDGVYYAGTSSLLDLGYNDGPSSWSHSHVITYHNGTRAVVTMWDGKWRA